MNRIVVDTNPLSYIYFGVPELGKEYARLLGRLSGQHTLLIPKIVYGELSLVFRDVQEMELFLHEAGIVVGEISRKSYTTAARRWQEYSERRVLSCPKCGRKMKPVYCEQCESEIRIRQHVLTDFLVGAYALETEGHQLVTNDAGYYSTYFPEIDLIVA